MRPGESFIAQPIRSLQTMLRVLAKENNNIPLVIPDGIYGPETLAAVTEFQRINDLPLTGITDQNTWEAISSAYDDAIVRVGKAEPIEIIMNSGQVYELGDEGPYVYLLQSLLIWLSKDHVFIPSPDHNGVYDTATQDAVSAFQHAAGLEATGQLDKITWKHLSRQYTLNALQYIDRQKHPNENII